MAYLKEDKLHIVTPVDVIRRDDGRILLLKRRDDETVYPGAYTFPGGKAEGNDTLIETLKKEVKEECGLDLEEGVILIKEKAIGRPDGQRTNFKVVILLVQSKESRCGGSRPARFHRLYVGDLGRTRRIAPCRH